jgi:5'-3' exonuclease
LIQQYKTLENIYENIHNIPNALKEKLLASKDVAMQSKSLVELMEVPSLT